MATARQQWKAFYRAARAAYRLFCTFRHRFPGNPCPVFVYDASKQGELRFDFCRLHGDCLKVFDCPWAHDVRMNHFRRRVRLPGTRIGGVA
ncbi:hypothetical protein [uncultured Stenotrophomonas sp.]|uniref:hypothetical protein n=1 Tax=uncultured Stenotrophomonas sp. TaxID=165438 RepID=UPI0025D88CCF|nr:hypothetical protein [uncultured Stenotrophomonas sp.]